MVTWSHHKEHIYFYTRAKKFFMSESFHSLINKYASKRIHFSKSHDARIYCVALDWNKNLKNYWIRL
jgi:hypothetical protein